MAINADVLHRLTKGTPEEAWRVIIDKAVEIASKPLTAGKAPSEVTKRDREIGALDYFSPPAGGICGRHSAKRWNAPRIASYVGGSNLTVPKRC